MDPNALQPALPPLSYASTSSDQVLGNSQWNNSKVMAASNNRSCKRPVLVRHPSLPDNEDDYEKIFSEKEDFTYLDFDQSSLVSEIGNLEMESQKFLIIGSDPKQNTSRHKGEPTYMQMQKSSPTWLQVSYANTFQTGPLNLF